jgi:IS5 family transposase
MRRLRGLIEPHYPKAGSRAGARRCRWKVMLRVYCLQQWYALSDPAAEEALYDSDAMRRFAGLELGDDASPDETTILNFRHLLERHELTRAIFETVNAYLREKGIWLSRRHAGRCDPDRRAKLDEEQAAIPRSGDDQYEEGQRLVFRDEGACRRRPRQWRGSLAGSQHRQGARQPEVR